jgi:hypothetical protein
MGRIHFHGFLGVLCGNIAGKPEALAEGFSGIMRKDDVGVLVHDMKYDPYDIPV